MQHPPRGSVSHGTMRHEDLIPCFMFLLETWDKARAATLTTEYAGEGWPYSMSGLGFGDPFDWKQEELAPALLEDLFEQLNHIAPPDCYFGAHVGDGSDYGFWQLEEDDLQFMARERGPLTIVVGIRSVSTDEIDYTTITPEMFGREGVAALQEQMVALLGRTTFSSATILQREVGIPRPIPLLGACFAFLSHVPEDWGDEVQDGWIKLNVSADTIHKVEAAVHQAETEMEKTDAKDTDARTTLWEKATDRWNGFIHGRRPR